MKQRAMAALLWEGVTVASQHDLKLTEEQERAARRLAQWELGDPSWADLIIGALRNPTATLASLAEEMGED